MVFTTSLLNIQHQRDNVKISWQVYLLCPWARHLSGWHLLYLWLLN